MGAEGDRWHRETWHRMTIAERREEQRRRHDEQFVVREYRCLRCAVVVDTASRRGHLGRCGGLRDRQLDQADLAAYFTEVVTKGAGWQVDATAPVGVQQAAGGLMDAGTSDNGNGAAEVTPADKRAWAAQWAKQQPSPTAVGLIAAVKAQFGTGVSNRVAAKILKAAKGSGAKQLAKAHADAGAQAFPVTGTFDEPHDRPVDHMPAGHVAAGVSPGLVVSLLDALALMRQLGVESFKMAGREFAVR